MSERARIFTDDGSQAVRLPESCRFPADQEEVLVRREGNRVILEPVDEWSEEFLRSLGSLDEEIERPPATPVSRRKDPFE